MTGGADVHGSRHPAVRRRAATVTRSADRVRRTAPTRTAPTRTAPTRTAPTRTAPTRTAPTRTAPTRTAPTRTAPTRTALTRTALGLLTVLAGLCYSLFLAAPLFGSRLDPARSYVSELAAPDQPAALLFRLIDGGVGLVMLVAGIMLARTGRPSKGFRADPAPPRSAGPWFAVLGLGTVLDAVVSMPCAPSADARCSATEAATLIGPHDVTSLVTNAAVLVAMALIVRARRATLLGRVSLVALPVAAVAGLVAVLHVTVLPELGSWVGWAQRAQVLAISAVLVGLGVSLTRAERAR